MSLAWTSLAALAVAIFVSCVSRLNVGLLSIVFAWIIGVYLGGMSVKEAMAGFPVQLFLTLAGVTLLFTQAQVNGTLDRVAHWAVSGCRGNVGLIPIVFFLLALTIASLGPGNIAAAALIAPMAMAVAGRAGIPVFLMAIMVGNGASAGSLSPFAPTGVIVNGLMERIGLGGAEWYTYWTNLLAHAAVAFVGYALFGGLRLFRRSYSGQGSATGAPPEDAGSRLEPRNWLTIGVIAALLASVMLFDVNVGTGAFAGAVLLALVRAADEREAIRRMPWGVILMVCGVTVLIAMLEKTDGMALFSGLLARFASRETITGMIAFVTGLISVYSSTSGVVLPAFLPTIPSLVAQLGGGNPLAIASSMNIGSHLVDVSPVSTIGALCLASVPRHDEARSLFNKLLAWGLSMSVVGGVGCYLFFGP